MTAASATWYRPLHRCEKYRRPAGYITYDTDRSRGVSHGDLAWATMLAVINEPIGAEREDNRGFAMEF